MVRETRGVVSPVSLYCVVSLFGEHVSSISEKYHHFPHCFYTGDRAPYRRERAVERTEVRRGDGGIFMRFDLCVICELKNVLLFCETFHSFSILPFRKMFRFAFFANTSDVIQTKCFIKRPPFSHVLFFRETKVN
jgi:hypothetical protein